MPQSFDRETWKARVAVWWREHAPDWKASMAQLGVNTAYGLLTASAFLPLLEVYGQDPGPAVAALSGIVSNVGTELLSNLWQGAYDKATAPRTVEEEIAEQPDLRAEYQQMLTALDALGAAQAALGEQWADFKAQLADELQRMGGGVHVETEGGVVFGDVTVSHGDFVARDKIINIYPPAPQPNFSSLREAYLGQIVERTARLPLRGLDISAGDPTKIQRPRLSQIYVNLDTKSRLPKETRKAKGREISLPPLEEDEEREPISALKAAIETRRLVLLGDPGAGKSTFIRHLAFSLAMHGLGSYDEEIFHRLDWPQEEGYLLPVVIILRDFARWALKQSLTEGHAGALGTFLTQWLTHRDLADFVEPLREALRRGEAIVFLDGLDEIPTGAQRALVREAVADFARTYQDARMIVTCRTLSYQAESQQLSAKMFTAFELAPFTDEKINALIQAWYEELADLGAVRPGEVNVLVRKLRTAVQRADIKRMASNPLLLTVMALVHAYRGRLPEARALLYEECTDLLLWRWEEVKIQGQDNRVPGLRRLLQEAELQDVDFKRALWALAFNAHAQGSSVSGDDGSTADIAETDLLRALRGLHPHESWDWAAAVVRQIKERAGLLIERETEVYAFPHRTFQEYLAACHLSVQVDFAKQAVVLSEEAAFWREVVLLAVGRQVHVSGNLAQPLTLVTELCPDQCGPAEAGWRRAWLAGEILEEAGGRRVRKQGVLGKELLTRVQTRLTRLIEESHLTARERAEVGDVLGRLGDPRFDPDCYHLPSLYRGEPEPFWGFVQIPAGSFVMGEGNKEHRVDISYDYWIARYPVTVAQLGAFVDHGGYEDPEWWTKTGWAWRTGEWDKQVENVGPKKWLKRRSVELRNRPMWWEKQQRHSNRPIVFISWFEAVAYCAWLTEQLLSQDSSWILGENVDSLLLRARLPLVSEWEKAARGGDARCYPWGDEEWDAEKANTEESGISHASTVGLYPEGANPWGLHELAGNVWEWTNSRWAVESKKLIVCGGSWASAHADAHCSSRYSFFPSVTYFNIGFRVVIAPAKSWEAAPKTDSSSEQ